MIASEVAMAAAEKRREESSPPLKSRTAVNEGCLTITQGKLDYNC